MRIFRRKHAEPQPSPQEEPGELYLDGQDDSDVFLCKKPKDAATVEGDVTLFVYAWHSVAPGPLSWPFPNVRAALDAVGRMKNAVGWSIAVGKEHGSIEEARAKGAILVEQLA